MNRKSALTTAVKHTWRELAYVFLYILGVFMLWAVDTMTGVETTCFERLASMGILAIAARLSVNYGRLRRAGEKATSD